MDNYPQRVRDSLLPLSIAGTLPKAFEEWFFTGEVQDHELADEICQLCGQEELRYHFKIENQHTHHNLWIGSHCILRFQLPVYEETGRRLTVAETKKKLDQLTHQMQLAACIRALERLAAAEGTSILENTLEFYKKNKKLTPKQAFVIFWRLKKNNIEHHPTFFKIDLSTQHLRDDLAEMPKNRVAFFWAALTSSQKQIAIRLGHKEPR